MSTIEVRIALPSHPKTLTAARCLGVSRATLVGHLVCLWSWAAEYARSGDLSRVTAAEIAAGAGWDGDPDAFVDCLVTCGGTGEAGFLERVSGGRILIHDWYQHSGRKLDRLAAQRERQERYRARRDGQLEPSMVGDTTGHIQGDATVSAQGDVPPASPQTGEGSRKRVYAPDSCEYTLAARLDELVHLNNPKARPTPEAQRQRWADDVRLMVERDNREPADIRVVLEWCQQDDFWWPNVLSMATLRKQFDRLYGQMLRQQRSQAASQQREQARRNGPVPAYLQPFPSYGN